MCVLGSGTVASVVRGGRCCPSPVSLAVGAVRLTPGAGTAGRGRGRRAHRPLCASPEWAQSRRPRLRREQLCPRLPGADVRTWSCHETPAPPPVVSSPGFLKTAQVPGLRGGVLCGTVSPAQIGGPHFRSRVHPLCRLGSQASRRDRSLPGEHAASRLRAMTHQPHVFQCFGGGGSDFQSNAHT